MVEQLEAENVELVAEYFLRFIDVLTLVSVYSFGRVRLTEHKHCVFAFF